MKNLLENLSHMTLLPRVIAITITLVAMIFLLVLIRRVSKNLRKQTNTKEKLTMIRVVAGICRALVFVLTAVIILQVCGVNVSSTVAGLGIASAVVGVALQDYIKNIISGLTILSDRFYMVGDVIRFNGLEGEVINFNVRTTKIELLDDHSILNINNRLFDQVTTVSKLINLSAPIPYGTDSALADKAVYSAIERIKTIEGVESCRYEGIAALKDSYLDYRIYVFCDPRIRIHVQHIAYKYIYEEMSKQNIAVPYPTYTITFNEKDKALKQNPS